MALTRFILHGGRPSQGLEQDQEFSKEFLRLMPARPKMLFNYFSRDLSRWQESFAHDQERIQVAVKDFPSITEVDYQLATEDKFLEQLRWCDLVYFKGGMEPDLQARMAKFPEWLELVRGKTVAASSAGVYFLSEYFYSNDNDRLYKGEGILKLKSYCHYDPEQEIANRALKALAETGDTLPILALPESRYVIIYQ